MTNFDFAARYRAAAERCGAEPIEAGAFARLADNECGHGRLPGDRTRPCGCWPQEPAREPIPEWVLADARDLHAAGMAYRKIASAVLPVTDCSDVPTCEELLKLRLDAAPASPSARRPIPR